MIVVVLPNLSEKVIVLFIDNITPMLIICYG